MYTNRVFGTAKCVLFIEVSSFQGILIREVPLYKAKVKDIPQYPNCANTHTTLVFRDDFACDYCCS